MDGTHSRTCAPSSLIRSHSSGRSWNCPRRERCSCIRGSCASDRLFTESGTRSHDGQRLLLAHGTAASSCTGVREYEQGESLRRVHWPSTARRSQLMVKELEDSPRDEIAVLLDCDAKAVVGRASTCRCEWRGRSSMPTCSADAEECWWSTRSGARFSTCILRPRTGVARSSYSRPSKRRGDTRSRACSLKRTALPRGHSSSWS